MRLVRRARRWRFLASTALSSLPLAPLGALAQEPAAFAPIQEPNLLGLSAFVGLVIFASSVAILHLTGRRQWTERERALTSELEASRARLDRARVFLSAEPQIIVVWSSATGEPDIEGDIGLVIDAPAPRRVLGFGAWLEAPLAQRLDQCVERLRSRGEGFRMPLVTLSGRHLEAEGRAIAGRAVLRIRDVSGDRMELMSLRQRYSDQQSQMDGLRAMLDSIAAPVWMRDSGGRLAWVNAAYARAVEAADSGEAVAKGVELLDGAAREAAARVTAANEIWRARLPALVSGERHLVDIVDAPSRFGSVAMAQDMSELEKVRENLQMQMDAHARTLDQLPTAVAIFDGKKRLVFNNSAYRQLWNLPQAFLEQKPADSEILDRLRAERRLPEQADFRGWKNALMSAYQSQDAHEHVWHLPDGRMLRVVSNPNPQGGLTYLFDDVSERFNLESQFNAAMRAQGETLDALHEGVAVFGSDGKIKLFNPAFAGFFGKTSEELAAQPHFDALAREAQRGFGPLESWMKIREVVTGLHEARIGMSCRLIGSDGLTLDCAAQPLPNGATLLTFIDVSAQMKVERALTERNRALTDAENLRNDFVHHLSFALRAPLTNVSGYIGLLQEESTGPLNEKQRGYVDVVSRASSEVLTIINDILEFASIDKDAMQLEFDDVDIQDAMKAASLGVQDRLADAGVELSIVALDNIGSFRADAKRVRQILFNLLANAISSSEPGQRVTLAALRRGDDVVFKASDSGRGLPAAVIEQVFARVENAELQGRNHGAGFGLSLVRMLVELHGGKVHVDSAPGEGTIVTCVLPARAATGSRAMRPGAERA
ncbi:MAG: PAS-domain containing protein [Hyphomicrobiales bacterium]|nr:PAS-domain containing protein [Hyphomicrobiales bacterium]